MMDPPLLFLTNILNTIIHAKRAPATFKAGEMILLYKTGSPLTLSNYRGLTLL
jgi:hypothetical protein